MKINNLIFFFFIFLFISEASFAQAVNMEINTIENNLLPSIIIKGKASKKSNILELMKKYKVPGVSIAVEQNGKLIWAKSYGIANSKAGSQVTSKTLFQAGSISKPIAAIAALKLVEQGKIDLDTDVNNYLKSWKLPEFEFTTKEKVTLRRLLTHTAGITVHGFPGYKQKDVFPDINTVLDGNGNTPPIFVDTEPGKIWRYSGGGYTIMEKIVEDVTGMPLEKYMSEVILPALNMHQSHYFQPLPTPFYDQASAAYNGKGKIIEGEYNNYPEQAAAGLWTTPSDLVEYYRSIQNILNGNSNGVLQKKTVEMMFEKDKNNWGLGPALKNSGDELIFGHGGKNAGFTNNMLGFAYKGDAIIVMTNGDNGSGIIGPLQSAISEYYQMGISKPTEIAVIEMTKTQLQKFNGEYQYSEDEVYKAKVKAKNGKLSINLNGKHVLYPIDPLIFMDIENPQQINFIENEKGEIMAFSINENVKFMKIK